MKMKEKLTGAEIFEMCTEPSLDWYCDSKYCYKYDTCKAKDSDGRVATKYCDEAIIHFLDSEESMQEEFLRRLWEQRKEADVQTSDSLHELIDDLIDWFTFDYKEE